MVLLLIMDLAIIKVMISKFLINQALLFGGVGGGEGAFSPK